MVCFDCRNLESAVLKLMATTSGDEKRKPRVHRLNHGEELRFEVADEPIQCQLLEGVAELFGTELRIGYKYTFLKGAKVAVFTFHGCKLEIVGTPEVEYVASETPMTLYINLANALEGLRMEAVKNGKLGPNVLVAGPGDVGKSTLCRILLNYAVRVGRKPIYVDLDLGQGDITIPGNIGSVVIEKPADLELDAFQMTAPIVFHFGKTSPAANPTLYDIIMGSLAMAVQKKQAIEQSTKYSGTIINTCGWVQGYGYQSLLQAINHFNVDIVLVLDQERLLSELKRDLSSKPNIKVLMVNKSGGVVSRSKEFRAEARDQRIRCYFYGTKLKPLYPYSFDIPFGLFNAYKIGSTNLPDSCLPLGMKSADNSTKLVPVQPSPALTNHILAISCASSEDDLDKVIRTNVYGFIAVSGVHTDRQIVTVLSPQPLPLPKNYVLILSDVQFVDME